MQLHSTQPCPSPFLHIYVNLYIYKRSIAHEPLTQQKSLTMFSRTLLWKEAVSSFSGNSSSSSKSNNLKSLRSIEHFLSLILNFSLFTFFFNHFSTCTRHIQWASSSLRIFWSVLGHDCAIWLTIFNFSLLTVFFYVLFLNYFEPWLISRGKRRQGEVRREKWTAERFFRVKILSEK